MGTEIFKNSTVLYAEDEHLVRRMVAKALRRIFAEVYEAENGAEALKIFLEHRPDVVLTDIEMPIMNGLKLVESIKENSATTPCIVVTAYKDEYHISALADETVYKPVIVSGLIEAIQRVYQGK